MADIVSAITIIFTRENLIEIGKAIFICAAFLTAINTNPWVKSMIDICH